MPFVCLYYTLYQLVAHNVFFAELHTAYARYAFEHFKSLYQTARCGARQVNLGYVAGYYHFGAHTQTGQEHFKLVGGGVLGLVEHNHGVVQCAAAHKCQRGYLYHLAVHVFA